MEKSGYQRAAQGPDSELVTEHSKDMELVYAGITFYRENYKGKVLHHLNEAMDIFEQIEKRRADLQQLHTDLGGWTFLETQEVELLTDTMNKLRDHVIDLRRRWQEA